MIVSVRGERGGGSLSCGVISGVRGGVSVGIRGFGGGVQVCFRGVRFLSHTR